MKLKPVRNMIAVDVVPQDRTTKGGIIIPGNLQMHSYTVGRVLAVGPGTPTDTGEYIKPPVNTGDLVLLMPGAGVKLSYEGEEYLMADAGEVIATVDERPDLKLM